MVVATDTPRRLVCLMLVFLLHPSSQTSNQSYVDYIMDMLPALCPLSVFCKQGPELQLCDKDKKSCCMPCSCQADCYTRGNCCPDADAFLTPREESENSTVKCKNTLFSTSVTITGQFSNSDRYYVVDTCPSTYSVIDVIEKCENPKADTIQDIKDLTLVSIGETIYANHHCALCHNVTTFTLWTPVLYSFDRGNDTEVVQRDALPIEFVVESVPVDAEQVQASRCFLEPETIRKCNASGEQDFFDDNLVKACEETVLFYPSKAFLYIKAYKNPFCLLCNRGEGLKLPLYCKVDEGSTGKKGFGMSFAVTLDLHAYEEDEHADSLPYECLKDEKFDQNLKMCRNLHCPMFSLPTFGQCISNTINIPTYSVSTLFDLTVRDGGVGKIDKSTAREISDKIYRSIALGNRGCEECQSDFVTRSTSKGIEVLLLVTHGITVNCTFEMLMGTYKHIWQNPFNISVQIHNESVAFTSHLNFDFLTIESFKHMMNLDDTRDFTFVTDEITCSYNYMLQDRFCEYFEFSVKEFNELQFGTQASDYSNLFRFIPGNEEVDSVYRICVADYLMTAGASDARIGLQTLLFVLVPLLFVLGHKVL